MRGLPNRGRRGALGALAAALALALIAAPAVARAGDAPPGETPPTSGSGSGSSAGGSSAGSGAAPGSGSGAAAPAPGAGSGDSSAEDEAWNLQSAGITPEQDAPGGVEADDGNDDPPTTGAVQAGIYADSDRTQVYRTLGLLQSTYGNVTFNGRVGVDSVTSASVDVRSSPQLSKVDVVTSASGRTSTSGGQMTDLRFEATGGAAWTDTHGVNLAATTSVASERDYASVSGGVNGSVDILDRTTTLLAGASVTDNWVSSVLDTSLHGKMLATGWSAGVARVLTPNDAVRLRYDGRSASGDNASPYRYVRFGNWGWSTSGTGQIVFSGTLGSADGLSEKVPDTRVAHAAVLEWVHALGDHSALHPSVRVGHDSWGIDSVTAAVDLRVAEPGWRLQLGYRYYQQGAADFFQDKYTMAPTMYSYYTSDKELGRETGHLGTLGVSFVLKDHERRNDSVVLLDARADAVHYEYPGFVLLPSRDSVFVSLGLTWEP